MTTKTRYIGTCPCCTGNFKVRNGNLVHHGYNRPGFGHIVGDCFGALKAPHELSDSTAKGYLELVETRKAQRETQLAALPTKATFQRIKFNYRSGEQEIEVIDATHRDFEACKKTEEYNLKVDIKGCNMEIVRVQELVLSWTLSTMTTVEEEVQANTQAKADRVAQAQAKKAAKLAEQVAKFQKRIDSADRRNNTNALADIWESAQGKLPEISKDLSKADALALLDRDSVWAKHGLKGLVLSHWKTPYNERAERTVLSAMRNN